MSRGPRANRIEPFSGRDELGLALVQVQLPARQHERGTCDVCRTRCGARIRGGFRGRAKRAGRLFQRAACYRCLLPRLELAEPRLQRFRFERRLRVIRQAVRNDEQKAYNQGAESRRQDGRPASFTGR